MEEARRIFDYLPVNPPDEEYIRFLWDAFESNYKNGKYQFSFIAVHMLFMCFVYYQIAKIYKIDPNNCKNLMVFTGKVHDHIEDYEKKILQGKEVALAPLQKFSLESEKTIMGLFLSIQCDREEIRQFRTIVDSRNKIAHSNGNIFYKNKESLEDKINEMLSCVETIQLKSAPLIEKAYKVFLQNSSNPDEREYFDDESQIRDIFIHGNYLSIEDVKIAKLWDISILSSDSNYQNIVSLETALKNIYTEC